MGNSVKTKVSHPPPPPPLFQSPTVGANPHISNNSPMNNGCSSTNKMICELFSSNYPLVFERKSLNDHHHGNKKLMNPDKEKLYNYKNMSELEEQLPDEIILYILQFLPLECVIQLGRVSKNFYNYWIDFPQLWNHVFNCGSMLYLPWIYEDNPKKNLIFFHNQFKPKIVNSFKYLQECNERVPLTLKFLIVGSQCCGKSVLVDKVFKDLPFEENNNYVKTIGVEFCTKCLQFSEKEERCLLHLWDSAGDARFRSIIMSFFRGVKGYFYCFDLNDRSSFEDTLSIFEDWKSQNNIDQVSEYLESQDSCLILLGLKADLPHKITRDEIDDFLEEISNGTNKLLHSCRVQYFELSSKKGSFQDLIFPFAYVCTILNTPQAVTIKQMGTPSA
ncbi:hypothetical protein FDP41_012700 [Naegleria fowleri]|uniref:F-box domain-containing protein n=1 Tax=Naegleria fowleri TaxID=5763 RepID=A0A6A5C2C6_NAEFO|nr:uncharacterized protein FDP41_012700 [Naegleria fowleri]KAF0980912.1 hypothetical protein FDP41_012700 [Naegleria fowleri]